MELAGATLVTVPRAVNAVRVHELRIAVDAAHGDSRQVIVLLGDSEVFCQGMEIATSDSEQTVRAALESFAHTLGVLHRGNKPAIAFVRGRAIGGGVGLAAACDAVLATNDATFMLPELLFGLAPAMILPYLAQRVGVQKARRWALMAETVSAQQAEAAGLADFVCSSEKGPATLKAWVRQLRRLDPTVIHAWKGMTAVTTQTELRKGLEFTFDRLRDTGVREGLRGFLETGVPPWMDRR